jgi:hypothetical protein
VGFAQAARRPREDARARREHTPLAQPPHAAPAERSTLPGHRLEWVLQTGLDPALVSAQRWATMW